LIRIKKVEATGVEPAPPRVTVRHATDTPRPHNIL
jgi:hypothetical protein